MDVREEVVHKYTWKSAKLSRFYQQSTVSPSTLPLSAVACRPRINYPQRQRQAEPRPFAWFTFDLDIAAMRLDDHLGLKHADSQSLLLCRLKRAEQGISQEIGTHSATVVGDGKDGSTIALSLSQCGSGRPIQSHRGR